MIHSVEVNDMLKRIVLTVLILMIHTFVCIIDLVGEGQLVEERSLVDSVGRIDPRL